MKNNEFRALIKKLIKIHIELHDIIMYSVDETTTTRVFYLFNSRLIGIGAIRLFMNNEYFSLSYLSKKHLQDTGRLNFINSNITCKGKYFELYRIQEFLKQVEENMDMEGSIQKGKEMICNNLK